MKIRVTQEHIDRGAKWNAKCCPIAMAMRAIGLQDVVVGERVVAFQQGEECENRCLPAVATNFIRAFDCGKPVQPFTFEIPEL